MPTTRLEYLFHCYLLNEYTEEEKEELMALLNKPENEVAVKAFIDRTIETTGLEMELPGDRADTILQNILQYDKGLLPSGKRKRIVFNIWPRLAVGAMIIFMAGALYWVVFKKGNPRDNLVAKKETPVLTEGRKTLLTLGDGTVIVLNTAKDGDLTNKEGTNISKQAGRLIYRAPVVSNPGANVFYNTLSTPRGEQYEIVLPDSSKVWLNAASSLRFPTAFTGSKREVELTGEAYFEVARNKAKPFQVNLGEVHVNVTGTHFNVNAYDEESAIKTSLLAGSVTVSKGSTSALLHPSQQAVLNRSESAIDVMNVDVDEVTAWKNGLFQFDGADITTIMRQIRRWYDIEIVYSGKVPVQRFNGKISRSAALSEVLQILQLSNVKFKTVGKKIIVQ